MRIILYLYETFENRPARVSCYKLIIILILQHLFSIRCETSEHTRGPAKDLVFGGERVTKQNKFYTK